jgi:CO/xanthine dehydrogenase Mo-binding subunit/CO/xanthine dehydrogenase FAD-binding subunit
VRYRGDEVAAVAAVDLATARLAADRIDVRYEIMPAVLSLDEAMASGAPLVHEDTPGNLAHHFAFERGDVDAGFKASDVTVEGTWESARQWHTALETIGCVASWNNARVTMWCNTQTPFLARGRYATALGVPDGQVRVIQTEVGGGFGGKSGDDNASVICAILARKSGRPVKLIHTREEEFMASHPRMPIRYWVRLGFARDGRVKAKEIKMWADNGAYTGKSQAILGAATVRHDALYKYPAVRADSSLIYTNLVPTGALRGFGNPSADWAVEQAWDLAAQKLGIDIMDLLRMNAVDPGDVSPHNHKITSCELKQCIDKAAAMIGWREKRSNRKPNRGLGIGCSVHVNGRRSFGNYDGSSAMVRLNEDGRATVITGEGETGTGTLTVLRQIAAEELGLPYENIDITRPDTDVQPHALGALASRLTYVAGNAVKRAAAAARAQLLAAAAAQLRLLPEDLVIINGRIGPRGGAESAFHPVPAVVRRHLYQPGGQPILGIGTFDNPSEFPDESRFGNESGAYNFAAEAVEIEVDPATGKVTVLELAAAVDCGTVIHPQLAEGQVQGAVAQGLGYALMEYFDWREGCPTEPSLKDYKIPTAGMMPVMHVAFADSYEPTGPFGAKGVGEIGIDSVPAILANAVADATGVRITKLPITAEKIYRALHPEYFAGPDASVGSPTRAGSADRLRTGRPSGARPAAAIFIDADSVAAVVSELAKGGASILAGGVSHALQRENTGYPITERLVGIRRVADLHGLSIRGDGVLHLGAAVSLQTAADDRRLCQGWPALAEALLSVGVARLRRMITVGGNVAPLDASYDVPVALIALGARVVIANSKGKRTVSVEDLFQRRALGVDELIVSFELAPALATAGAAFFKFLPRGVWESACVSAAALVDLDANGTCRAARLVIGSAGPKPVVAALPELVGHSPSSALLQEASKQVRKLVDPVSDVRGSAAYKREMAVEFGSRALTTAWQRAVAKQQR